MLIREKRRENIRDIGLILFFVGFTLGPVPLQDIMSIFGLSPFIVVPGLPLSIFLTALGALSLFFYRTGAHRKVESTSVAVVVVLCMVLAVDALLGGAFSRQEFALDWLKMVFPIQACLGMMLMRDRRDFTIASIAVCITFSVSLAIAFLINGSMSLSVFHYSNVMTSFTISRLAVVAFALSSWAFLNLDGRIGWKVVSSLLSSLFVTICVLSGSRYVLIGLLLSLLLLMVVHLARRNAACLGWVSSFLLIGLVCGFAASERTYLRLFDYDRFLSLQYPDLRDEPPPLFPKSESDAACAKILQDYAAYHAIELSLSQVEFGCRMKFSINDLDDRIKMTAYALSQTSLFGSGGADYLLLAVRPDGEVVSYHRPHNILLESWYDAGLLGVALMLLLFGIVIVEVVRLAAFGRVEDGVLVVVPITMLIGAMFGGDLYDARWAVLFLWAVSALRTRKGGDIRI